jgi:hypothetical protein
MATAHKLGNWYINDKGYPRFCSGVHRGQYVHRVVMAKHLGRALKRDEDVHHLDADKLNFSVSNLKVLGHQEHGWVSAAQHFWMKLCEVKSEQEWNDFFKEKDNDGTATQEVQQANRQPVLKSHGAAAGRG